MEWKDIKGYEGYYKINELGQVKRVDSGKILKQSIGKVGYPVVSLWRNNKGTTKYIHRMLAECFIPNPDNKREVNHIDGIKTNYDLENLEWVTPSGNLKHAYNTGLNYRTEEGKRSISKFISERNKVFKARSKKVLHYDKKGNLLKEYESAVEAAKNLGLSFSMVSSICTGRRNSKKWFFKYKEEVKDGNN